jgi:lycopene cyclase domain-containing protein
VTYTQLAVLGVVLAAVVDLGVLRTRLLTRGSFWTAYAIVVFFQLLTNGWLTGREIVRYDPGAVIGDADPQFLGDGRIVYAPVEDLLFGFALALWTLGWWTWLGARFGSEDQERRARV